MRLDIIIDTICPWCYVGMRRLERAMDQRPYGEIEIGWRPFQLNPDMPAGGKDRRTYLTEKFGGVDRARHRYRVLEEIGKQENIEFRFDLIRRTPNTLDSHRLIRFATAHGLQDEVVNALFRAFLIEGQDIGDIALLSTIASEAGLNRSEAGDYLRSDRDVDVVLEEDERARKLGVNGVPCYIVDQKYAVSGAQSPEVFQQIFDLAMQDANEVAAE